MKWLTNQTVTEEQINKVIEKINIDDVVKRLSVYLNIGKDQIFKSINEDDFKGILATLIINRGLEDNIDKVLNNIHETITDPRGMTNAILVADVITEYAKNPNAKIIVFGDYDCDGVTAGYVLPSAIREVACCPVIVRYPERHEGYGLNMEFCKQIVAEEQDYDVLLITVDNGITQVAEIQYLLDNGVQVVVTDHHSSKDVVPNCLIVDPHNTHEKQAKGYEHLCGCGVAFKVAQIVQENFGVYNMMKYTPYLAISTLSDVMPLSFENIALIQYGLDIINSKDCPKGIAELKRQLGLELITANDILWTIAPIINACGRLGDTDLASKLFYTDNEPIQDIVTKVIATNDRRKTLTKSTLKKLEKLNFDNDKLAVIQLEDCPIGIVGIIAGKSTELFNKPSIVVGKANKDGIVHGSARSCRGVNLQQVFAEQKRLGNIIDFGGHKEAAGISFRLADMKKLVASLNELVEYHEEQVPVEMEEETLLIDEVITYGHINKVMYGLSNIIPFDNRQLRNPTFALTDVEVLSYEISKNNSTNIKFEFKQDGKKFTVWAWGLADRYKDMGCPQFVHVAGTINPLNKNRFTYNNYSFNIVDIMSA